MTFLLIRECPKIQREYIGIEGQNFAEAIEIFKKHYICDNVLIETDNEFVCEAYVGAKSLEWTWTAKMGNTQFLIINGMNVCMKCKTKKSDVKRHHWSENINDGNTSFNHHDYWQTLCEECYQEIIKKIDASGDMYAAIDRY